MRLRKKITYSSRYFAQEETITVHGGGSSLTNHPPPESVQTRGHSTTAVVLTQAFTELLNSNKRFSKYCKLEIHLSKSAVKNMKNY